MRLVRGVVVLGFFGGLFSNNAHAVEQVDWNNTLQRIASGVVSIRVDSTRAFDTDWNSSSQATGFVVDAELGLIVTNRHVVTPGPVIAEAVFRNNEEVALTPVYRDPVHDFGLFRYNPADLRYIEPTELNLYPAGATVGREIRVIGNDAGEQLSILAGTIARLDRQAPAYGRGRYNDFNTYYYQAASGTSGGSSGSPVVDIEGRVVALNAGGSSQAASSFFLPLDRIKRAVELTRKGKPVTRGTLQMTLAAEPFDELKRLGLSEGIEELARASSKEQTGMLVVTDIIRGAPADGALSPGDILVRVNGTLITQFLSLAKILDDSVGEQVQVEVERGGKLLSHALPVSDLHAISPAAYLQFGDAIVHDLSYQQARHYNRPLKGVYVANPGYIFSAAAIPRAAVITEFNGKPVDSIVELESALSELADGAKVSARFVTLSAPRSSNLRIVRMDRRWFPARYCHRDDALGRWPCRDLAQGPPAKLPLGGSTEFVESKNPIERALAPSLVLVNYDMPYTVSGVSDRHYYGSGLIVDARLGLVAVDRNTVPIAIGDVTLTFAGSLEVPGKVEFIHPVHNLAMVSYDPTLIGDTPVRSARFDNRTLTPGEDVWVVGLGGDHRLSKQKTAVASVDAVNLPLTRTLRFRDSNIELISAVNAPANIDGVMADSKGRVLAMWSSFAYQSGNSVEQVYRGIPADLVQEFVDLVRNDAPVYSLETEFGYAPLSSARKLGLSEQWADRLEAHNRLRRHALAVTRIAGGTAAKQLLRPGDLVLAVDGDVVNTFRELERATQKAAVDLTIWRDGKEQNVLVATRVISGEGIGRALMWAGAILQEPHRAVAMQRGIDPTGVYVAFFNYGSPATRYGLRGGRRIIEVDGQPTPDLDSFIQAVADKQHGESVRLKTVNFNEAIEVTTLKMDLHYWPAYEIKRTDQGWQRMAVGG